MKEMAKLKTFDTYELLHLLNRCAQSLEFAYQETLEKELFTVSQNVYLACEYLMYRLHTETQAVFH